MLQKKTQYRVVKRFLMHPAVCLHKKVFRFVFIYLFSNIARSVSIRKKIIVVCTIINMYVIIPKFDICLEDSWKTVPNTPMFRQIFDYLTVAHVHEICPVRDRLSALTFSAWFRCIQRTKARHSLSKRVEMG